MVKKRGQRGGFFFTNLANLHQLETIVPRIVTAASHVSDDIKAGKNWKEAAIDRISTSLKQAAAGKPSQSGSGIRRRRTRKPKKKKNGVHSRRIVRVH